MFHIVLECEFPGLSPSDGLQAASDITEEFNHPPWHQNAICTWDGRSLRLEADNGFDADGRATCDEFSDVICACIAGTTDDDGNIEDCVCIEMSPS